jgi:hypothetical protein
MTRAQAMREADMIFGLTFGFRMFLLGKNQRFEFSKIYWNPTLPAISRAK